MNEGESAGGGHQRASPAPPAVSDHRSVLSSTNTTASVATTTYTGIITPTTITVATPEAHQVVATTFVDTSVTPRSFQQAFTQQHLPKLQQQINTTTTRITSTNLQSSQNKSLQQKFQKQLAQAQQTSMPQKSLIAVTANTASDFVSLAQNPIESITGAQNTQRVITTETSGSLINSFISTTSTSSVIGEAAQQDTYSGSPLAKRPKLVGNSIGGGSLTASLLPASGSTPDNSNTAVSAPQDINALKKRIVEQKYFRLRSLKERHTENVAELFYLQSGGNMMDYPTWRKKPPTPQFVTFSNAYRLDQLVNEDKAAALAQQQQQQQQQKSTDNIATIIGVASGNQQQQQQQQLQTQNQTQDYLTAITNKTSTQSQIATEINSSNSNSSGGSNSNSSGSGSAPTTAAATSNASNLLNATVAAAAAATTTTTATATTSTPGSASVSGNSTTTNASGDVLPQGAEIKIPAVGATPVAVSTKLPAAVVQLTQQGGTPLVPAIGSSVGGGSPAVLRRNGNGANAAASPGGTAGVGSSNLQTNTPATPNAVLVPATVNGGGAVAAAASGSSSGVALSGTTSSLNTPTASNSVQEFSFKAKQEVYVLQRVSELQREGLWTEKRLPKLQEPSRPKAHWDYLLEEMVWLAADFAQERKWKKNAAKKCAKMVQKYFQDKANAAQKAEKAQEAHLKRIAAFLSKEVKMFWSNVEKLVEYKHHTKLEEKRKKALDQHLSFIVDQTEKFSQQLAEGMNKSIMDATAGASGAPSMDSSRISSPKREAAAGNGSDDDFRPESGSEDDEETIAKAEEEAADVKEEVAALEKESQMDLDDFLKDLPKGYLENRDKIMLEEEEEDSKMATSSQEDDADDAEFEANEESDDDENTISKQEEDEMDIDHQKEIDDLEADNDLSVEQLLAKYKSGKIDEPASATTARNKKCTPPAKKRAKVEIDSDDDEVADDASSDGTVVETESESGGEDTNDEEAPTSNDESEENEQENGLKSLLEDTEGNSKDDMIKDAAALAESIQPKGNTLSSTNVVTPVPFLLKHSLREYQHIGLDWLVTMNERKLNGILADEMGLGKTIQTIALLAHLACVKGNWGPHLIVVPSSVMLNWEMEFKKWCPAFKILTYYGTQKERKMKRVGWTKPNAFHVCITSYKLVVQDQQSFRRKKWKYLILDEAQNIKNFKSQRWQLLLNFSTERRLLLTGTPLQNDLMELWSLMHFLMPYVFSSHREFKEWFSNPMTGMIEGNMEYNETLISRLHKVIRPFLLRRLKKEVEKQMPKKYEHVVMCRLSNRQRYLYDDFMSRAKTKETLQTGSLLSVINVLMQLRKVCNHPNMFEVRPTISPFQMEGITYEAPRIAYDLLEYDPFTHVDLHALNLLLIDLELTLTAYVSHKSRVLEAPRKLIEEIDSAPAPPPSCPRGKFKFYIRVRDQQVQENLSQHNTATVRVGASPAMRTEGNKLVPLRDTNTANIRLVKRLNNINPVNTSKMPALSMAPSTSSTTAAMAVTNSTASGGGSAGVSGIGSIRTATGISVTRVQVTPQAGGNLAPPAAKIAKLVQHGSGKEYFIVTSSAGSSALSDTISGSGNAAGNRLTLVCKSGSGQTNIQAVSGARANVGIKPKAEKLLNTIAQQVKNATNDATTMDVDEQETTATETSEGDPIYNMQEILEKRKEQRVARLKLLSTVNRRRIEGVPIYGEDCRDALVKCVRPNQTLEYTTWQTRSHTNCSTAMTRRDSWTLSKILKSYEKRVVDLRQTFGNFVIYVPSACAPRIRFFVQHLTSGRLQRERAIEQRITQYVSPKLALLHPVISAMTTQFPDPRLIQYDCGKLQTLDRLLRQLKSEQHRVLIFTQMTKMLDVLEAFLNYHGHIYLRLDGSTRVEQRQVLMERFNGDKRIFCFILSTRSGGVGINLTGADTVIFYDSDWNPTMDAQAQDRCHRIGQTRDVHIYRLVSEKTIEVNILKKANQKRMLSDMAIEGGNFTTTYFKSSTIKDLFNLEQADQDGSNSSASDAASANGARADKAASSTSTAAAIVSELGSEIETEKQSLRAFESALAAAEDEQDVQATKTAKAEAAADLAEFDETIPIDEATMGEGAATTEMSRADLEMQNLVKQLSPIERYAMRFVEETGAAWTAEQLRAAEEEIEAQKREWEANRLAALQKEEEMLKKEAEADEMLTYNRKDASNQIWISDNTMEQMPMWCPPTPPQDDNDIYIDYSLTFMYEMNPIPEVELPPVYIKKDYKRSRCDAGFAMDGSRRPLKMRREDNYVAPRSLFDRPSAAIARIRRDLKNQRYRGVFKPNVQIPGLKPQTPQKQLVEPEGMAEWTIFEDIVILHVLVNLQGLPCNLMVLSPGHTPNWDLVSEIVNFQAKTFRSAKQCRWRYEMVIQPREEGKFVESPKKQKKMKAMLKSEYLKGPLRYLRTTQLYANDNNTSFTKLMRSRFDCIKAAYLKKAPPPKRHFSTPNLMNPKHMEVLQEFGISNYDQPISPLNIAAMKANKIREKQRSQCPPPPPPVPAQAVPVQQQQQQVQQQQQTTAVQIQEMVVQQQQNVSAGGASTLQQAGGLHTQQLQIQHIPSGNVQGVTQQPTATAIVLQHAGALPVTHQQQAAGNAAAQSQQQQQQQILRAGMGNTQIVKAIVAPQTGLLTAGQMQQLTQQAAAAGAQHVQLQQQGGNVGSSSTVSVVLTTPVQTLSSSVQSAQQHVQSSNAQIVSISPQTIVSSGASQSGGSIVQTIPSQTLPQVVSVSQLATVGTVLTTSANLQPSGTVTTLNTSALRAQRIVAATTGALQDVVLQQRSGNPSPTIVSMSNLGPNVAAAQFQAAQLRLTSMPGTTQQVTKVPVSTLQQSAKLTSNVGGNAPPHIQLYRQRQQLKVLQTTSGQGGGQTLVQTASGQTALVNAAGTIIQGSLVQTAGGQATMQVQGQKVAVATVSSSNMVAAPSGGVAASVATVQVAHQGRTQFIKQVAGKQTIARQVGDDMVLVKRQVIGAHQKAQVLQQGQIFNTTATTAQGTTVQLQQQQTQGGGGSAQQQLQAQQQQQQQVQQVTAQQIATLVKTSSGAGIVQQGGGGVTVSTGGGQQQGTTVNMALSHLKPGGQIKVTTSMANQAQMRQLHMQPLNMPRKINRMTQIATGAQGGQQVTTSVGQSSSGATVVQQPKGAGGVQTQLVHIQNTKSLPSSVTVQQIQHVMRQGQQGSLAATGLVLSKTSVGRVIPVSVASQSNQRQTIQVVSAASAQAALAAGNLRAHVTSGQNIAGTIKVGTAGGNQSQTQQTIHLIQQQVAAQQGQRQNASPVRLQTAGGNLVAVVQQQSIQQQQQQGMSTSSIANSSGAGQGEVMTITQTIATSSGGGGGAGGGQQQQQQQQTVQQSTAQQVRTLVKKKIMQIRSEKE